MKFWIGLFLGLAIASAAAQSEHLESDGTPPLVYMPGGVKPDDTTAAIKLDADGNVLMTARDPAGHSRAIMVDENGYVLAKCFR